MRLRFDTGFPLDLAIALLWVAGAVAAVLLAAPGWLQAPLGFGLILFWPGYAVVSLLFPERFRAATPTERRRGLLAAERTVLSVGSSVAVVALVGMALNAGAGINVDTLLGTLSVCTAVLLAAAFVARDFVAPADRIRFALSMAFWESDRPPAWVVVLVALSLAAVAGAAVFVAVAPDRSEEFTEFYLLGDGGLAACYPRLHRGGAYLAAANETCAPTVGNLTVGIVNHEGREMRYWLRTVWTREVEQLPAPTRIEEALEVSTVEVELEPQPVDVELGKRFEPQYETRFAAPPPPGNGTWRLSFQLFTERPGPVEPTHGYLESPYRRVYLWIDA